MRGHSGFTAGNAPENDELVHLDTMLAGVGARIDEVESEIARLDGRVALLTRERTALVQERGTLNQRRTTLAIALTRVRPIPSPEPEPVRAPAPRPRPAPTPAPPPPPPPAVAVAAPEPVGDEASALSVQTVLLTLGGLLLGVAAITFTAVAWTTFGPMGRAAILGSVTLIALAVPWLLNRRGLAATAETISAVALLLVGLDGYAAHSVGFLGVDRFLPTPTYAGLVLLITAGVSFGYRRLALLHTPGYVALMALQPVLPLVAVGMADSGSGGGSGGSSSPLPGTASGTVLYAGIGVLAAAMAAQDLAIVRRLRGSAAAVDSGLRVLAWVFVVVLGVVAWVCGLVALVPAPSAGVAVVAAVALLSAAALGVAVASTLRPTLPSPPSSASSSVDGFDRTAAPAIDPAAARAVAAGFAVVAVVLAVGIPSVSAVPDAQALPFAALVAVLAYAVRKLPTPWRGGAVAGGWWAAGALGGWSILQVAAHLVGLSSTAPALPVSLLCLTAACTALPDRAWRHHAVVAGLALTVLALPVFPLAIVAAAVAFGASTLLTTDHHEAATRGTAAGVLGLVAVAFARADPTTTAAVLGTLLATGSVLAVTASRRIPAILDDHTPVRGSDHSRSRLDTVIAATSAATAIAAGPGAVVALGVVVGLPGSGVRVVALLAMAVAVLVAAGIGAAGWLSSVLIAVGAVVGSMGVLGAGTVTGPVDAVAGALPALAGLVAMAVRVPRVFVAGAVAAAIGVVADIAENSVPGTGLAVAATLAAVVATAGPNRPGTAGTRLGSIVAALAIAAVALPLAGGSALAAAIVSVRPPWTSDISDWPDLAADMAVFGWQLPVALALTTVAVTAAVRRNSALSALVGTAAVVFAVPSAFALPWWTPMALSGTAAALLALGAARLRNNRDILATAITAGLLGLHAAVASLARPGTTAAVLGATVVVCVLVAVLTASARFRDAAVGGALAALPGAAAATAAALSARPALVLSLGLATASLALGAASLIGLARRAELPAAGAVVGALICVAVAAVVPTATGWDHLAAGLLLAGAASRLWRRRRESRGAAGATLAFVAEMSQLVALLVPGLPVLTTAVVVAVTALAVRRLPPGWRSGPLGGLAIAAGGVAAVAALATVVDAYVTVATLSPWGTDLGRWLHPEPPGTELFGWQPAAALMVLAVAAVTVRRRSGSDDMTHVRVRPLRSRDWLEGVVPGFALVMVALAAVGVPIGSGLAWWAPAATASAAATAFGVVAIRLRDAGTARLAAVVAAVLTLYAGAASLARPMTTALILTATITAGAVLALMASRRGSPATGEAASVAGVGAWSAADVTGGGAVFLSVAAVPSAAVSWLRALELPVAMPHVAVGAVVLALVGAWSARQRFAPWARAGLAVAVTGTLAMPPGLSSTLHIAVAAVVGMVGAVLVRRSVPVGAEKAERPGVGLALWTVPSVVVLALVIPLLADAIVVPFGTDPWSGVPPVDGWVHDRIDLGLPALALVTLGLAGLMGFTGHRRWLAPAVIVPAAATVLIAPVAVPSVWPAPVVAAALVAISCGIAAARITGDDNATTDAGAVAGDTVAQRVLMALCCALTVVAGGAALAGATATRGTTFATLGAAVVAGGIVGAIGRHAIGRTVGWLVAAVSGLVLATLAAAELDGVPVAAGPFLVAVLLLAGAAVLDQAKKAEAQEIVAVESVSVVAAVLALATAAGLRGIATVLIGYGAVLGLSAMRPGRRPFAPIAGAAELLAWWMLLFAADIGLIEAYTLPFALFALVGGVLGLRRRPVLRSWVAYGPALAAAFLPSLALVLAHPGEPLRRLLVGAAAIGVVVVGGARRWQAPVVVGAVVLVLVTLHELVVWWDLLPRWIPLAAGGLLLVTVGATYERRRRDVRLIRTAVKEMR